ncbi:hypothetical protein [Streptomyces hiroshimensis]|uniref:Uncharacterized protein n=1 Tax=Streptomyces hiroshimensis TaxID=66424 RepID=A0ABQ2YLV9_9ACTN|nr:hypothetical protein [Streptomyces hiroshimensis]GGX88631.1 hypothetical protein GCM10010324_38020 [Streptomyces hiroshimensis]
MGPRYGPGPPGGGPDGDAPRPRLRWSARELLPQARAFDLAAPTWLRGRPGNIVPIVAATKESRPADNLAPANGILWGLPAAP